jgi:hypothetical protein
VDKLFLLSLKSWQTHFSLYYIHIKKTIEKKTFFSLYHLFILYIYFLLLCEDLYKLKKLLFFLYSCFTLKLISLPPLHTHTHTFSLFILPTRSILFFFLFYSPFFSSKFHQMTNINYLFLLLSIYTKNYILLLLTWEKSTHTTHTHFIYLFFTAPCSLFLYIFF